MENSLTPCEKVQSVDNILKQVAQIHQSELWKTLQPVIKVEGTVKSIKHYSKVSYFTLAGAESTLSVKCPTDCCPAVNQEIIVRGHPYFKPSKYPSGIAIEIEGKPIGEVEPSNFKTPVEIVKNRYLKLSHLISAYDFKKIIVLGSEMTIRDVLSQIDVSFTSFVDSKIVTISNKSKIIESLKDLDEDISSFALVRGGDDESLNIWNDLELINEVVKVDKPFYVALGHTHKILGISHYADESFGTPSVFGSYLNQTFKLNSHVNELESEVVDLSDKLTNTKRNLDMREGELKTLKNQSQAALRKEQEKHLTSTDSKKQKSGFKKEWVIIGVLILILYYKW